MFKTTVFWSRSKLERSNFNLHTVYLLNIPYSRHEAHSDRAIWWQVRMSRLGTRVRSEPARDCSERSPALSVRFFSPESPLLRHTSGKNGIMHPYAENRKKYRMEPRRLRWREDSDMIHPQSPGGTNNRVTPLLLPNESKRLCGDGDHALPKSGVAELVLHEVLS